LRDTCVYPGANGNAAIKLACLAGSTNVVKQLLSDDRVDPTADDQSSGANAILLASRNGCTDTVKLLLSHARVNPTAADESDSNALILASENGHTDMVKLLLADGRVDPAWVDVEGCNALMLASESGHTDTVKLLLSDVRVDPAVGEVGDDLSALMHASENGHTDVVRVLLSDPRVDPAAREDIALQMASTNAHPETMSVLLQDPRTGLTHSQIELSIRIAIENGFVDCFALLFPRAYLTKSRVYGEKSLKEFIELCARHGRSEMFNIVSNELQARFAYEDHQVFELSVCALCKAHQHARHEFVSELLTRIRSVAAFDIRFKVLEVPSDLFPKLASMHVKVLCVFRQEYDWLLTPKFVTAVWSIACRQGNVCVMQVLLENHRNVLDEYWTVDHFNYAALREHVPVLRLLSLARYGGLQKLAHHPPLNRICARKVLGEMHMKSACVMMLCIKKKTNCRVMARLADVMRDVVTGKLLRWKMRSTV
jgi:hypothetical protein